MYASRHASVNLDVNVTVDGARCPESVTVPAAAVLVAGFAEDQFDRLDRRPRTAHLRIGAEDG